MLDNTLLPFNHLNACTFYTSVPQDVAMAGSNIRDVQANASIDTQPYYVGKAAAEWVVSLMQNQHQNVGQPFSQQLIAGTWVDGTDMPTKLA